MAPEDNFITAYEPDKSLKNMIGEDVDLGKLFTPEKIKACQKLIDNARDEFFLNEMPKVGEIKDLLKAREQDMFARVEHIVNDMRSQARLFGFAFITLACGHIMSFCEDQTKSEDVRHLIISRFIDILDIALRHKVRDEGGALEKELAVLLGGR